jgi:hypothetical protein
MENLYLVTDNGGSYHDHIPFGVFTFQELKNNFPGWHTSNEDNFPAGKWVEFDALNLVTYPDYFTQEQINHICSSEESWKDYLNKLSQRQEDYYNNVNRESFDFRCEDEFRVFRAIRIVNNQMMPDSRYECISHSESSPYNNESQD